MSGQGDRPDSPPVDDPAILLGHRYRRALLSVALLVLLNPLLVQPPILRLMTDAPVINVSGRQRMLSQRLAKEALALVLARNEADRRRHLDELDQVLRRWSAAHDGLRRGDRASSLPGRNSAPVRAAFDDLEPFFTRMRDAAQDLARGDSAEGRANLATILANEAEYLPRMDHIVGLYEREARGHINRLIWTGWGVTALILIALAGIGRFILRDASRTIERQFAELREARDALEARVRERTRALESVNLDLEREARERALAEERQRTLLEQFSHVARTTTIGEMASGLAHELNQPLGAIANYTEGCLVALESPGVPLDEVRTALAKVLATTLRAGQIVKRIRRFVTRHRVACEPFEPNRLVTEVEEFFRDEARGRGIALTLELAPELPSLWGDPVQIQQVLVNLVRNAVEALSDSQHTTPTVVMKTAPADSGAVEFRVTDNGEGISGERLAHIFDTYFSTRDQGMGMGLSISRTIVEAHHGQITVESLPGVRTTFLFTLPATSAHDAGSNGLHRGR
jgi:C4-dicarboxylate-specific signal transduction histidine kinase